MAKKFKLKIKELGIYPEDKENFINKIKHLKFLKTIVKMLKDSPSRSLLNKEINHLREYFNNDFAQKFFKVQLKLGPHVEEQVMSWYPTTENICDMKNDLINRLSKGRREAREMNRQLREFNGMRYEMVGPQENYDGRMPEIAVDDYRLGTIPQRISLKPKSKTKNNHNIFSSFKGGGRVFLEAGSISKMLNSEEYSRRITRAKKPYDTRSNYVGVELELICSVDREVLNQLFIDAKLAGMVYVKHDGSIARENGNETTHEVTILGKESNINEIVSRVCKVLNSDRVKAYVNNSCGLHVHLDMRKRDAKLCYQNLYKTLPVLAKMVPVNRTQGEHAARYCAMNNNPELDIGGSRYQALNPAAVRSHQTLELRLHSGSTNAKKINNFINILIDIVNKNIVVKTDKIDTPDDMKLYFGISDELVSYMKERIEKFKNNRVDTRADHFEAAV